MSPKSRGRPAGRGKQKKRGAGGSLSEADKLIREGEALTEETLRVAAEETASGWLGAYWANREPQPHPEDELIRDVIARARVKRTPGALAAIAALRLVCPVRNREALDEAAADLAGIEPAAFTVVPLGAATGAWTAEDPWGSRQVLFVEYGGYSPHALVADVTHMGGGSDVEVLALSDVGLADRWDQAMGEEEFPLALSPLPVAEALGQLAALLAISDEAPDRVEAPDYWPLRALAHSRCVGVEPIEWTAPSLPEHRVAELIDEYQAAFGPVVDVAEAMVGLLVEYGEDNLRHGLLAWTPDDVGVFLLEWLPDTVEMDSAAQATALRVTKSWVRFCLGKRGLDQKWVDFACSIADEVAGEFARACAEASRG
ncbi:MAG: hypothetical protein ACT4QG_04130 [Sporichthyaceae bacterium]